MQTHHTQSLPVRSGAQAAAAALTLAAALTFNAQAQPGGSDGTAAGSAVVAIVKVPKPWYAPRFLVVGKMRDSIAQYQRLPGLAFKAYTIAQADGDFGGIYLWKDLASARAWFAPAWFERVQKERGVAGQVRFFEVLAAIDTTPGGTAADTDSASAASLITWPMPAGTNKARLTLQFQAASAADRHVTGLLRRYDIVTGEGRMGHVSLWRDRRSAQQALATMAQISRAQNQRDGARQSADASSESDNPMDWSDTRDLVSESSWRQSSGSFASRSSASDVTVEWFDTPILTPSTLAENTFALSGTAASTP